jgi:flavin reductase (DIM6/NTAB) family NADH-FMN oxidoreductase RutF
VDSVKPESADTAAISQSDFRAACGLFPTGVTVVTRRSQDGKPYGMTVSSFTSVSLEPPLILVCIEKRAGFAAGLSLDMPFAVNVLREDQQALAVRFSRAPEMDRFSSIEWETGWEGVPLLHGAVASFSCSAETLVDAGDHFIVVGRVRELRRRGGRALVWCESAYHCLPGLPAPN